MAAQENWISTGVPGVDILRVVLRRGDSIYGSYVAIRNTKALSSEQREKIEALGFLPFAGQSHARRGTAVDLAEMRGVFPQTYAIAVNPDTVVRDIEWRPGIFRDADQAVKSAATQPSAVPGKVPSLRPSLASAINRPSSKPPVSPPAAAQKSQVSTVETSASPAALRPTLSPAGLSRPAVKVAPAETPAGKADLPSQDKAIPVLVASADPETPDVPAAGVQVNAFQCSYRPASRLGIPIANIPIALSEPTERALQRIVDDHGDIDRFVADKLQWSLDELESYLSPEQIDAVGMAVSCMDAGQGFLLGDQTGLGKGRVVAAIARAILLAGRTPIVVTEKENLFSDLYRDIADIGSLELFGAPFALNDESEILDPATGDVLYGAIDRKVVVKAIKAGKVPKGYKVVLATYSQFNQKDSPKAKFLNSVAKGGDLVLDECHNAVGDSNTSVNLAAAMDEAGGVVYSSATFARDAQNLAAYRRLFPASMQSSDLLDILKSGGRAVAEAMSQMLAEAGSYIRREKDLSGITLTVVEDEERLLRNRTLADSLSPVLAEIAALSRSVADIASLRNEEAGQDDFSFGPGKDKTGPNRSKEYWYSGNFGSRLSVIVRQAVTAMLTDFCVERCLHHIEAGRKPVVVIESTMESLMREMMGDGSDAAEVAEGDDEALAGAAPANFRDALNLLVDRTMQLSVRRPKSKEAEKIDVIEPHLVAKANAIKARIAGFPELPLSPIDTIIADLKKAGRVCGEISARNVRVEEGRYVKKPALDRIPEIAAFNRGDADALVLTGAGSTGLSLHASEKFADQRQRVMIEIQIPSNVVSRSQTFGRVDRRGQVSTPLFETLSTGLPLQTRNMAVQNRKMADLSANVTGSSEAATSLDVPDLFDAVGNEVARDLLESRPSLAERMFIAMKLDDAETAAADLYHIDKIMQRLALLGSLEQDEVFAHIVSAYEAKVADMAARGQSVKGTRAIGDGWTILDRKMFDPPIERDGQVFGQAVYVTTIERDAERRPLGPDHIAEAVKKAQDKRADQAGAWFQTETTMIRNNRKRVLHMSLPKGFVNVDDALKDARPNAVKAADQKLQRLLRLLEQIRPGSEISLTGADGIETGVVVDVVPPGDRDTIHQPGRWMVRYVVPGDEKFRSVSLAGYMQDAHSTCSAPPKGQVVAAHLLARFERAPKGTVRERRKVMDGNPLRAVITARHQKWSSLVTWTDVDGQQHRSVLIPKSEQNRVEMLPGRVRDAKLAQVLLDEGAEIWTNQDDPDAGASLFKDGNRIIFSIPGSVKMVKAFSQPAILSVTGAMVGDMSRRQVAIPAHRIEALCDALAECGHAFNYSGRYRDVVMQRLVTEGDEDQRPAARCA